MLALRLVSLLPSRLGLMICENQFQFNVKFSFQKSATTDANYSSDDAILSNKSRSETSDSLFFLQDLLDEIINLQLNSDRKKDTANPTYTKTEHATLQNIQKDKIIERPKTNESNKSKTSQPNQQKTKRKTAKSVRFADACGSKLLRIKFYDPNPKINFDALDSSDYFFNYNSNSYDNNNRARKVEKTWLPLFFLSPNNAALVKKASEHNIQLESLAINGFQVSGSILVVNLSFEKEVWLRFSFNNWSTYHEIKSHYSASVTHNDLSHHTVPVDRFIFQNEFMTSADMDKCSFCLRFEGPRGEFWDNNEGLNYSLKLVDK